MAQGRRSIAAGACVVATSILVGLPALSSGASTVKPKLRSFDAAQGRQAQAADPTTEPPLHGTNPHGQGTVAVIDTNPSPTRPFSADTTGRTDNEDIVVGRARGEQRADGAYHGHITIAALFGNEILGVDTIPGQSRSGPLDAVQTALLTPLCNGSGNQICLSAVTADSATTTTGSTNRFSTAHATLGGATGLDIGAAESNGNITSDANCQTSHGDSQVASVTAGGGAVAGVSRSTTDSRACRGQAPTQTNTSSVLNLGGVAVPIPAAGCATGAPDTITGIPTLLPIVCNADDTNGTQAAAPYGVRDALDVYVLATGATALTKLSTASSESLAVAPAAAVTPPPAVTPPKNDNGGNKNAVNKNNAKQNTGAGGKNPGTGNGAGKGTPNAGASNAGAGNGPGNGAPECSDGVDNDGDGVIDIADPGCHSDGNANNPASFNPNDDSELNGGSARAQGGELPFTGTDVLGLGLGGSLLLAAGLAIRGRTRRRDLAS